MLTHLGAENFIKTIFAANWKFAHEQWQAQMWTKLFAKLNSPKQLFTVAPQLENYLRHLIPEVNAALRFKRLPGENNPDYAQRMTRQILDELISLTPDAKILVLPDGPYSVVVKESI